MNAAWAQASSHIANKVTAIVDEKRITVELFSPATFEPGCGEMERPLGRSSVARGRSL